MPPQKKKRVLLVGYGLMGRAMSRHIAKAPWAEVAGVAEPDASARQLAGQEHQLDTGMLHSSDATALKAVQPDIVCINTPSELHYAQATRALRSGCHVLVAKPVTSRFSQAVRLVELARQSRRKIVVGQQMRFNRHYSALRAFLATGELGKVESVQFLNSKPRHEALNLGMMDEPAMLEMSCHHFDALLSLFPRAKPEYIQAIGFRPSWSVYSGHCMVNALMRLSPDIQILYHGGFSSQADCYELRLEGSRGALRCRGTHMSASDFSYEFALRGGSFSTLDLEALVPARGAWEIFMEQWGRYLHGGPEPAFSARRNLSVFALLSAGIESIHRQRGIDLRQSARYEVAFGR